LKTFALCRARVPGGATVSHLPEGTEVWCTIWGTEYLSRARVRCFMREWGPEGHYSVNVLSGPARGTVATVDARKVSAAVRSHP
jgi:hypothetical protein